MYFLTILATTVSARQMAQYLFRKEIVLLMIRVLEYKSTPVKLKLFTIEALKDFFAWD